MPDTEIVVDPARLVIRRPLPDPPINDRQAEYADRQEQYTRDIGRYRREVEMFLRLVDFRPGMRILEIGGGVGYTSFELAALGGHLVDIDICPGNPEFVRGFAAANRLDVASLRGDTCALPFGDGHFDAVYSKDTFEHVWDVDLALTEQARVLRPGGRIVIVVGNLLNPRTFGEQFFGKFVRTRGREGGPRWLFTKSRNIENFGIGWYGRDEDFKTARWWKRRLRRHPGLEVCELTTTRAFNFPERPLYRLLRHYVGAHVIALVKR
ncbi:MAG: methyltransferase domain-containing protein [Candidatus Krumholzibacteriota bacterium]|nr:methyltransferase domain-containing protein [Candidatus Krumholzibacteriota bacterium]